jgi:hypothetical protein
MPPVPLIVCQPRQVRFYHGSDLTRKTTGNSKVVSRHALVELHSQGATATEQIPTPSYGMP